MFIRPWDPDPKELRMAAERVRLRTPGHRFRLIRLLTENLDPSGLEEVQRATVIEYSDVRIERVGPRAVSIGWKCLPNKRRGRAPGHFAATAPVLVSNRSCDAFGKNTGRPPPIYF